MIKAIKKRIFIEKDEYPEKIGLFYVPKIEGQFAPPYLGTILAVGSGITDKDYVLGARVLFHDLAGTEFQIDGKKIFSIYEHDVLGIILDKNIQIL